MKTRHYIVMPSTKQMAQKSALPHSNLPDFVVSMMRKGALVCSHPVTSEKSKMSACVTVRSTNTW